MSDKPDVGDIHLALFELGKDYNAFVKSLVERPSDWNPHFGSSILSAPRPLSLEGLPAAPRRIKLLSPEGEETVVDIIDIAAQALAEQTDPIMAEMSFDKLPAGYQASAPKLSDYLLDQFEKAFATELPASASGAPAEPAKPTLGEIWSRERW